MLTPIFKAEGTTEGERKLTKLADLSFFGLWSYASVHRETIKGGNTLRHEVADLIVLFGKDVVVFSEKDIKFPEASDVTVAWGRWFRQSVSESVGQLRGAERYIKSKRSALFLDAKCTRPLPFPLDTPDLRVHLVAICRNSSGPGKTYFAKADSKGGSSGSGTLAFLAQLREEQMLASPFCIGDFDPEKTFIHVFDEEALSLLLTELDAGPDFIEYLLVRERAVRKDRLSVFHGEEDFLAVYLSNMQETGFGDYQPDVPVGSDAEDVVVIQEGLWTVFTQLDSYAEHAEQRAMASTWKAITNDFSHAVLTANVGEAFDVSLETHERAVRAMASENRVSRAVLGRALVEKFKAVPTGARSARVIPSLSNPERLYIFLIFPWTSELKTYEAYRAARTDCMKVYAQAAQVEYPAYSEIVVLGADTKGSDGSSETVLVVERNPDMSEEEIATTRAMMAELNVLMDVSKSNFFDHRPWAQSTTRPMGILSKPSKLPGVNEPCFCGSGKKYKKCCRP